MRSGSEGDSYVRLIDVVSLNSRLESNKEETKVKSVYAEDAALGLAASE